MRIQITQETKSWQLKKWMFDRSITLILGDKKISLNKLKKLIEYKRLVEIQQELILLDGKVKLKLFHGQQLDSNERAFLVNYCCAKFWDYQLADDSKKFSLN